MEQKNYHAQNVSEKLRAKFPAITPGYSMEKLSVLMTLSWKSFSRKQAQ